MKKKLNCVLLVDDDEGTNFLNRMILEKTGVAEKIETVFNGKEALEYLTSTGRYIKNGKTYPQPVLILLDINMPVMDGWEFMEAYHNLPDHQKGKIVIVMLTTSFNPDDRQRAEKITEISGYSNKPLSEQMLRDILQKYFPDYL
ncbi:MAG: response regulator [Bacteroidota bacterium]